MVPLEVEVLLGVGAAGLPALLAERAGHYGLILASRPNNLRHLMAALDQQAPGWPRPPVLYDAEAVWALRAALQSAVQGQPMSAQAQEALLLEEARLAAAASHVMAVNETEAEVFRARGCTSVSVVSHGFTAAPTPNGHAVRQDLLFVGALDDDPSPNADALTWLVNEILPRVQALLGTPLRLLVAGRCAAPRVRALAGPQVILLGQVADLGSLYDGARVFVAPHRFAAGIPTKVLEAAARGLPCVCSELLAAQLGWRDGHEVLTASTADGLAQALARLYGDPALWSTLRQGALQALAGQFTEARFEANLAEACRRARAQPARGGTHIIAPAAPMKKALTEKVIIFNRVTFMPI